MIGLDTLFSTLASRITSSIKKSMRSQIDSALSHVQSRVINTVQSVGQTKAKMPAPQPQGDQPSLVERIVNLPNPIQAVRQSLEKRYSQYQAGRAQSSLNKAEKSYQTGSNPEAAAEYLKAKRANELAQQRLSRMLSQKAGPIFPSAAKVIERTKTPVRPQSQSPQKSFVERLVNLPNPSQAVRQAASKVWAQRQATLAESRLEKAKKNYDDNQDDPQIGREYARAMRANFRSQQNLTRSLSQKVQPLFQSDDRDSPLNTIVRAAAVREKAQKRYDAAEEHRNNLKHFLTYTQRQLAAAPSPGQAGHDPKTHFDLSNASSDASKKYQVAEAQAANALSKLAQSSNLYARSTSLAALFKAGGLTVGLGMLAIKIPEMLKNYNDRSIEDKRWMSTYSPTQAAAYASYDMQTERLNYRRATATESSNSALIESQNQFREAWQRITIPAENATNQLMTLVTNAFADKTNDIADNPLKLLSGLLVPGGGITAQILETLGIKGPTLEKIQKALGLGDNVPGTNDSMMSNMLGQASLSLQARKDTRENNNPKKPLKPLK